MASTFPQSLPCGFCSSRRELQKLLDEGRFSVWTCATCYTPLYGNYEYDYMTDTSQRGWAVTAPDVSPPSTRFHGGTLNNCSGPGHQEYRSRHVWQKHNKKCFREKNPISSIASNPKDRYYSKGAEFQSLPPPCWVLPKDCDRTSTKQPNGYPVPPCVFRDLPQDVQGCILATRPTPTAAPNAQGDAVEVELTPWMGLS